jgi:DNA polymerase-3 subunit alpha
MKKDFTHLHVHTHFSLLNALPKIPDLVARAKKYKMKHLAITDNGSMYGCIQFYEECKKNDINPIIGVDFYVATRTRHDKEARIDNRRHRLVLLAKTNDGYKNLMKMVTDAHLEGFYYKPRIDRELIEKYNNDLICIMPAFGGDVSDALRSNDTEKAKELTDFYQKNYGAENFYLELTHHPEIDGFADLTEKIKNFAEKNNIPLVATQDVYYMDPDDKDARATLLSIQSSFGGNDSAFGRDGADFSFIDQKQANELFADTPEAIENTQKIAEQCHVEIELGKWKFPNFKIESGLTPGEELKRIAYLGIEKRGMEKTDELVERIEYELEIIEMKGYSTYFLAVADMLAAAKERGILSNTRGSAAGSLVSYLSGITTVDPMEFNLPFERFLNPERPSAPDVDMDLADDRRDELIEYVREKYGHEHVAQIGTFGTMAAKGVVRDVTRAMGFEYSLGDQISKLIPMGKQGFPMTIDLAIKEVPELKELIAKEKDVADIIAMAKKIEGCARHIGVHAAGVVISPDPLTDDVPIQWDPKGEGKLITQYDMYSVGEDGVGLLKFDFLGLKNLTIMANTKNLIKAIYDEEIDLDTVPNDDKKTYEMLARGETAATFQLNGQGMTKFLKELKPTSIHDINAMIALYRPGPLAFIPDFIERKHNPEKVKYLDDRFKEILEPTFGILIYQDDIMMIAVKFAGYSWGEADKFRKAMGKKIPEIMAQQYEKFTKGCMEVGGLTEKQTKDLWESIETFAAYGFNKSHTVSYGRVAYLTSYLKANYPVLYMTAVLMADSGDVDKIAYMVEETKRMGIEVLPPDINESFNEFTALPDKIDHHKGKIRFGLSTIKNFGEGIGKVIIDERKRGGEFKSLEDFLQRVNDRNLNKKSLEALIKAGAMDKLGDRAEMLSNLEDILVYSKGVAQESADQNSLFSGADVQIELPKLQLRPADEEISDEQRLTWEKELLGLYVSGHPLDKYEEKMKKCLPLSEIKEKIKPGTTTVAIGHVDDVRVIRTKKGDEMAFVKISDKTDSLEIVFFPKVYAPNRDIIEINKCIAVKGNLNDRNDELSILVDKVKELGK